MSPNTITRFYYLDAARGFAAIGIVIFHFFSGKIKIFSGLYILVDFFFVLSGFVLARSYTKKLSKNELKNYINARILRLFPMPLCSIFLVVLYQLALDIKHISNPVDNNQVIDIKPVTVLLATLMLQAFSHSAMLLNFPLWSLSAEWITNLIMLLIPIQKKPRLLLLVILSGIILVLVYEFWDIGLLNSNWISNIGRALSGFCVGILVRKHLERSRKSKKFLSFVLLHTFVVISFYLFLVYIDSRLIAIAAIPFGLIVLEIARLEHLRPVHSSLRYLCSFLGKISFGVYVWHTPVHNIIIPVIAKLVYKFDLQWSKLSVTDFLLTLSFSILISIIFYRYIDPPLKLLLKHPKI